jgi:hypothetical protein
MKGKQFNKIALILLIVCSSSARCPDSPVRNLRALARNIFTLITPHEPVITFQFIWAKAH